MSAMVMPLLHADPVFPQRDFLLDPGAVAERIGCGIGINAAVKVEHCERVRATYRAGQSLRVLYKLRAEGEIFMLAARAFPEGADGQRFARQFPPAAEGATFHPVFGDLENHTVFWTFPNDRKIANLPLLMSVPQCLSDLLNSRWTHSRLAAYAPEKCATVQCLDDQQNVLAYAKVYAGHDGRGCYKTYNDFAQNRMANSRQFSTPRAIAYSDSFQILLLEPIHGKRIADLEPEELERGFNYLGRALASFHAMPIGAGLPRFTRLDARHLQEAAGIIGLVRPDVAVLAQELCDSLCGAASGISDRSVYLHGDVHPKNGILRDQGVVMIDLDQAGSGPAAADLGSLLAALRYEVVTGSLSEISESRLIRAFLSGYSVGNELPHPAALRWFTAAALFAERALRAVSRVRTEGLEHLRELLLAARNLSEKAYV